MRSRAPSAMSVRTRVVLSMARIAGRLSRHLGGQGATITCRIFVLLASDQALRDLVSGPTCVVVSGTNGKTTTAALIACSVDGAVSNSTGANLLSGVISTYLASRGASIVILEVDELVVARVVELIQPDVVALLNLSRDQLDRSHEVRRVAESWRSALTSFPGVVVANVDDPLVAWAAQEASSVRWVAAGQPWQGDAVACPCCRARALVVGSDGWSCDGCGFARPVTPSVRHPAVPTGLPGRCNLANAVVANAVLAELGHEVDPVAWAGMSSVAGRYSRRVIGDADVRMLLAKNPAGWLEIFEILRPDAALVIALNARSQDGRDTSWIWDVPFERLALPRVVCAGERATDIALRLHYAGIEAIVERDIGRAIRLAGSGTVELVANYTAFQQALDAIPVHV